MAVGVPLAEASDSVDRTTNTPREQAQKEDLQMHQATVEETI